MPLRAAGLAPLFTNIAEAWVSTICIVLQITGAKAIVQKAQCFDHLFKMHFQTPSFIKGSEKLRLLFK